MTAPRSWTPTASFESTLLETDRPPVQLNGHLQWMHHNWDLAAALAPPAGGGIKGVARRITHRFVMAVLSGYFERMQAYLGVNVRALDAVAKQVDVLTVTQRRTLGAVRVDMVDLAHHLEEELEA